MESELSEVSELMEDMSLETPVPIFAWDFSGSTASVAYYHSTGRKYLDNFLKQHKKNGDGKGKEPGFLLWDTQCEAVNLARMETVIATRAGRGGTSPSCIIEWINTKIPKNTPVELWLITDGQIDSQDLGMCSKLNEKYKINYSSLQFIIIDQHKSVNMSVGAAFFPGCKIQIFMNEDFMKEINTAEPFDYSKLSIVNFEETIRELSDYIQAKFMGSASQGLEEAEKLGKLRQRLLVELDTIEKLKGPGKGSDMKDILKDKSAMMAWFQETKYVKSLTNVEVKSVRDRVDSAISTLINYIHNENKSYKFLDVLKIEHKQAGFGMVQEQELDELDLYSLVNFPEVTFFDAVTLETENATPVLLLQVTDLINKYWVNMNYKKFRMTADCPLFADIDESIGHVFSLDTVIQLDNGFTMMLNPMNKQPSFGGLILHPNFDIWNDYLLMKTYFRGKNIATCHALFYYQIYLTAKKSSWVDENVTKLIQEYALRRIQNSNVPLAFGSLPLDPKERVPVPLAIFYCLEGSSLLFGRDSNTFLNERLRQFWGIAQEFMEILTLLQVPFDRKFVTERVGIFKVLSKLKTIGRRIDKTYWILSQIFEKDGEYLTWIKKQGSESDEAIRHLALLNYSHKDKIPFDLPATNVNDYCVVSYNFDVGISVPVLKETFRPAFGLHEDGQKVANYKKILECVKDVKISSDGNIIEQKSPVKLNQAKLLSVNKLYIDFVIEHRRFPETVEEFESFLWKSKYLMWDRHNTQNVKIRLFPPNSRVDNVHETFNEYAMVTKNVEVQDFIAKGKGGCSAVNRLSLEGDTSTVSERAAFVNSSRNIWLHS